MMLRNCLLLFILIFINDLQARETKELKRAHTYNLRRWIQLLEFSQTDTPSTSFQSARLSERNRLFKEVASKLSKSREERFRNKFQELLSAEASGKGVSAAFRSLRLLTFDLFKVVALPSQVPELGLGRSLYAKHCQSCHGVGGLGNGPLTRNPLRPMDPGPLPFNKLISDSVRSPYSFFNTILIGSTGTAMSSFDKSLKPHEIWSLAFYLSSEWLVGDVQSNGTETFSVLSLYDLATKTNQDLTLDSGDRRVITSARNVMPFTSATKRR